ncbi:hypothetical protein A2673_04225 [Candidatus Kaiserbacteria bacterium RIFCSPHIGHO2_01_FULL_50_13]|uniref:Uncharacterized protein n=1 Tax=Candidatus Kaiserbacteria bacterium RIFCSPLOWO2_01_FULL_50_24 TaxID=1798507 RepID=A0A1F6EMZ7_9BACT|nr:MAG: hypothetical protein A2673_04225 [Candidatus Kaiserbacteria bacterium RIFCSPHIGHO2_01_FULL_50_13]OGG75014.1 MAG: hypothetical protein A3A34_02615 [Candidatus Kaiserbacteria bacterium RIFCSPLOWO2_01_FULL_50_24]OGG82057.1 MAG: hypothetical protein A3H74_04265 [Candidatus Kaiserbacteria bacterium RIFCSPLOWO2_02_FULL_51_13]
MKASVIIRARILSAFFIVVALILGARLYFVQIINGEEYAAHALGQYVEATSYRAEDRGKIFFSDKDGGMVTAALMESGWRIAILPGDINDPDVTFATLQRIVVLDEARYRASAAKKDDPYEEIAFRVSNEDAALVRAAKLSGVLLVEDKWRVYPAGSLAAHVIGFWGFRGNLRAGTYGLEQYFDDTLSRRENFLYVNPFAELFTNVGALLTREPTVFAGDLITSIEPTVEARLEYILGTIVEKYDAKEAGGIVMDPRTGELIALAALPTFDPNTYNVVENQAVFSNPITDRVYEMGSIMKPLTLAAGIDTGAVKPETTYNDRGFIMKSGLKISNFDGVGRGVVSMQEVLNQSLNTGAPFVVDQMGHETFAKYVRAFGLGAETGIDLPNERGGLVGSLENGVEVDYASASFGQGIATTPIAMVRALASLSNGGMLPEPHVVRGIRQKSGVVRKVSREPTERVISKETAETVTRMLVEVFDTALLEGALKQEHYSFAAKTGTAQIANPAGGGYYTDRYLHAFFGYFPAYEPRFIIFLYALEPIGERYASRTLARPFLEMSKFLINYYEIPPDR